MPTESDAAPLLPRSSPVELESERSSVRWHRGGLRAPGIESGWVQPMSSGSRCRPTKTTKRRSSLTDTGREVCPFPEATRFGLSTSGQRGGCFVSSTKTKLRHPVITEADTCRKYVLPRLIEAGWDEPPHSFTEQKTFTDGRIVVAGAKTKRRLQKRADYLLRYTRDYMLAVVEAKSAYKHAGDGLQQAKEYAEILDLKFAYSTNGKGIVEFDFLTGVETELDDMPTPDELWERLVAAGAVDPGVSDQLLTPFHHVRGYSPRYYQEIAVNRTVSAILGGQRRALLTMATGTGKTIVAFQICWKLWSSRWNRDETYRRPRILYLADRNVLIDDPKDKVFAPFGEARSRIESADITKSREIYFSTYQAIAHDERRPGLYREYDPAFFDLVIVDECHRGSARDESAWREILEYFEPAFQLGMTATPLRNETRDTYRYFGNPLYQYSLRQGIEDGFLAPYKVHRVVTDRDALGWRPEPSP
jgi:type I restriction enzyme, R subunit